MINEYIKKLRNLDNKFVDKSLHYITISTVNGLIVNPFDSESIAKKCEEKGKATTCKWTGLTASDIMKMWEDKASISREYGKKVDAYAETILEGNEDDKEMYMLDNDVENDERLKNHVLAFDQFYDRIMKSGDVVYVGREIEVWNRIKNVNEDFYVKGRLDALFYNTRTDTWIVIDWKSNEGIATQGTKWTDHMLGPAKDLLQLDWNTYTLQVYNYKEALLQNYLPEGTEASHVQCMIVNLPKEAYDNDDAVLGKGQQYKAYMGAFPYDENKINKIFEFAYRKDQLNRKKKSEENEHGGKLTEKQMKQIQEFNLF